MRRKVVLLVIALTTSMLVLETLAENILVLMSVSSKSHFIWMRPILSRLAQDGHNVTTLSVFVDPDPPPNVTYIHLESTYNVLYGNESTKNDILQRSNDSPFEAIVSLYKFGWLSCKGATISKGLQQLLRYPDDFRFDLVIYDFTAGPCVLAFLHKFRYPPLVSVTGFGIPQFTPQLVGGHKPTSSISHFTLLTDEPMTFVQRVSNFVVQHFDRIYRRFVFLPQIGHLAAAAFDFPLPDLLELERRTLIMLTNSHPAFDPAESLPPNVIPVGGLQIIEPNPLPKELAEFIEGSPQGTILFAMGTNFKSKMFNRERQLMFIEAFAQLPQYHFLWKYEDDRLPVVPPKNLMVRSWVPQNDVLAHPKVRAFISHCGLLSTQEATYHGVPLIGIPVYVDQHVNQHRTVLSGAGIRLSLHTLTTESIVQAIREITENASYRNRMALRSQLFRDQPQHPLDRAMWWIGWALRHPREQRLRSPTVDMNVFIVAGYDVGAFVALLLVICLLMTKRGLGKLFPKKPEINAKKMK